MSSYRCRTIVLPPLIWLPARMRAGAVCAVACAILAATPAGAQVRTGSRASHPAKIEHAAKQPFGNIPKGPLQIIISVDQQRLHLYSNGEEVAETPVATGVPDHPTPLGVFNIVQKQLYHRSNIYSGAPMPFMERLTWSGVALHEGVNLGHPASHGCIRVSHDFAVRLYEVSKLGAEVIIADPELRPQQFADAHLFVHKDPTPVVPILAAASIAALPTALAQNAPVTDGGAAVAANDKVAANSVGLADPPIGDKAAGDGAGAASAQNANANTITAGDAAAADTAHDNKAAADTSLVHDAGDPPPPAPAAPSVTADLDAAPPPPLPRVAPAPLHASKSPIAIFISRKTAKIYVRQNFEPVFSAPITIEERDRPFGTFVFTALQYLPDRSGFVWNVVSVPEREKPKPVAKYTAHMRRDGKAAKEVIEPSPPQSPQDVLARIEIPQDAIEQISQMIVPGSSLIVSDQGLGDETGEGTDFVVVMH